MNDYKFAILMVVVVLSLIFVSGYFAQKSNDDMKARLACYEAAKVNTNLKCE